jgi:superfamily II DNA or RNA helicase
MSFLANLRQQQPDSTQSLQLCYFLTPDYEANGIRRGLSVSLALAESHQSQHHLPGRPYIAQRQHLARPPQFLQSADIRILEQLIDADQDWLQNSQGFVKGELHWPLIEAMLDTQRCYIEYRHQQWQALKKHLARPLELIWHINGLGDQELSWRAHELSTAIIVHCDNALSGQPLIWHKDSATLAPALIDLHPDAIAEIQKQRGCITPESVGKFLAQHEATWQTLGLPLPKHLPHQHVPARAQPILQCRSRNASDSHKAGNERLNKPLNKHLELRDEICLTFYLCSDHYCSLEGEQTERYWDGDRLNYLETKASTTEKQHANIAQLLADFSMRVETGDKKNAAVWYSENDRHWTQLLCESRDALQALGVHLIFEPGFRKHFVLPQAWTVAVKSDDKQNTELSVQISVGDTTVDLRDILEQLHAFNAHYLAGKASGDAQFQLQDGRLMLIPAEQVSSLVEELGDLLAESGSHFELPNNQLHRLGLIHDQLPDSTHWAGDLEQLEQAIDLHRSPLVLDKNLSCVNATLRPYQWLGVCWMQHLKQHNVNGLLADDMGLGKTLQTLAHLCFEHQQQQLTGPALVVAPTSLLHNWAAEIERFAPQLKYKIIQGTGRHQSWSQLDQFDVLISSYQLVANDLEHWQQQPLSWLILDEAQTIKNPRTRLTQALKQIDCKQRLCLSGTPVENHLGELWSILDFLMPGSLGSEASFKQEFRKPIEQEANSARLQHLLARIAPFMLRRDKDQIAKDLPAKTQILQHIPLNDDQRDFYQQLKSSSWTNLQEQLEANDSPGQQHMLVLSALLKLRQACCDPRLLGEPTVSSAKREYCIEMLQALVAEKRAVLVFSQFTSMLELLAESLDEVGIHYLMLTGQTRQRQKQVAAFQNGEAPVFLISLKAGGTGLNLTRADTVIHYDPWWNQAAEQQATDRSHRIGQDKPVFVYKLIAEDTIEEKIKQLQERKAVLSQYVNEQAQLSGQTFALKLEDLLALWQEEQTES